MADTSQGIITANFHRAPQRSLICAIWFLRKDPNAKDKKTNLDPIRNKQDSDKIEALYQRAIEAMSSFGTYVQLPMERRLFWASDSGLRNVNITLSPCKQFSCWQDKDWMTY
jgi:hypothetical protein